MCFLKKTLSWLLIFQYLNTSVLYADTAATRIIFDNPQDLVQLKSTKPLPEEIEVSKPSLRIITTSSTGVEHTVLNSKLNPTTFTWKAPLNFRSKDYDVMVLPHNRGIKVSSHLKGADFSLHIKPDGTITVQRMALLTNLTLETLGNIHFDRSIKVDRLSLKGKNIYFSKKLVVNDLQVSGQVKNTSEGQLVIGQSAHVRGGNFINEGRIEGADGSFIDMHGGDFTNEFIGLSEKNNFRTQVNWSGDFALSNVGTFLNKSALLPKSRSRAGLFSLTANSFLNEARVSGHSLSLQTLGDLTNHGTIYMDTQAHVIAGRSFKNRGKLAVNGSLIMDATNDFFNEEGGLIRAHALTSTVGRYAENKGFIKVGTLSLQADSFHNYNKLEFTQKGSIEGTEGSQFINHSSAQVISSGHFLMNGGTFRNLSEGDTRGKVQVGSLDFHLERAENAGDIFVNGLGTFFVGHFENVATGLLSFSSEGSITGDSFTNIGEIKAHDMFFNVSTLFTNEVSAFIKTFRTLGIIGTALKNMGKLISQGDLSISSSPITSDFIPPLSHFLNEGGLEGSHIDIHVDKAVNKGDITSSQSLRISTDNTFQNSGTVASSEGLDISSLMTVSNEGAIHSTLGAVNLSALEFFNEGATKSEAGLLCIDTTGGENRGELWGELGIDLSISDMFTNRGDGSSQGLIKSPQTISLKGKGQFNNTATVQSGEDIDLGLGLKNKGKIHASHSITSKTTGHDFINEAQGEIVALRRIDLSNSQQFANRGLMQSGSVSLASTGRFANEGRIHAVEDAMKLKLYQGSNAGTIEAKKKVTLNVAGLFENAGGLLANELNLTSKGLLHNQSEGALGAREVLTIETPDFVNDGFVSAPHVTMTIGKGSNSGKLSDSKGITATDSLHLTVAHSLHNGGLLFGGRSLTLIGTGTGFIAEDGHMKTAGTFMSKMKGFENKGLVEADEALTFHDLEELFHNRGNIISGKGLEVFSHKRLFNEGTIQGRAVSLVSRGSFENNGMIAGNEGIVNLQLQQGTNKGELYGKEKAVLSVEGLFENEGLVSAPQIKLRAAKMRNLGKASDSKGFISTDSLELTVGQSFTNNGSFFGEKSIVLSGNGLGHNGTDGVIETKGNFVSSLAGFENHNVVKADKALTFRGLTQAFMNMGNIFAGEDLVFTSTSSLINEGFVQSTMGAVSLTFDNFVNRRLISALQGLLTIKLQQGENHNVLFGFAGIDFSIADVFTNVRVVGQELGLIESSESITFRGGGKFKNEAFVRAGKNLSIGVNVENEGQLHADESVLSHPRVHDFSNGVGAAVQAKKEISLRVSSLDNKGEIKAKDVSLTSSGEFSNSGKVFAKKLLLFLRGGANMSSGTMSGTTEFTLTLADMFDNFGQLLSPTLRVVGGGVFQNHREGVVRGEDLLSIEQTGLLNDGSILSQKSVDLVGSPGPVENRASGKIISGGTLRITESPSLQNAGTIHGKTAVELAAVNMEAGGEVVSPEGSLIVSSTTVHVKSGGVIEAKGAIRLTTEQSLQNQGRLQSGSTLHLMGDGSVTNHGSVFAKDDIDITQALTNTASGQVDSKGTLSLRGGHSVTNSGHLAGVKGITADLSRLENSGAFLASHGPVTLTIGTGRNTGILTPSQRDTISGKALTLNIRDKFQNQGDLHAEDLIIIGGSGTFLNSGQLLSGGSIALQSSRTHNSGQVQAETHIRFANKATIENTTAGRIVAKSQVLAEASATVTNLGAVLSEGTIEFKQPSYVNDGRLEAKGHISFPQSESLENRTAGVIISQGGGVLFPRLKMFTNHGQLSSHDNLSFRHLPTFVNTGKLHTVQDLSVSTPGDFVAQGQFMGQQNLSFQIGGTFTNRATLQSDGNLSVSGTQLALHSPLMGKKGVTLHATRGLTSHPGAIIHSSEGAVKLTGQSVKSSQGKVIGQSIEVHSQGAPFVDHGTLDSQNGLKLHTPHGWHLDSTPRSFPHSISIHGPIVGTGSLKVDGDITWSTPRALVNESDVQASGLITLTVPDHFKHLGKLIGKKGFKLKLKSLHNAGVLYGGGDSTLLIEQYFDNLKYFRVDGALSLQVVAAARMAAIEAIGHVNVDDIIVKEGVYDFYGPDADRKGLYHQVHIKKDWVRYWGNDDDNIKKFLFERKGLAPKKTQIIKKELISWDGREVPHNGFYKTHSFKPWGKRHWFFHRYALHYSFVDSDTESKLAFPGSSMVWKSSGLRLAGHEIDREGVLERQIRRKKGDRWKKNKDEQIHFWTTDTRKIRLFLSRKLDIDPSQIRIDRTETLGHEDHILTPLELQRQDIYRQGHGYARGGTRDWFFHAYEVHYSYLKEVDNPLATRFTNHPGAQFEQRGTQKHVNMIVDGKVLNHGGHMILEGKTTSRSRSFTNRSQSPQQPALFYGGSATFLTKSLENVSGVLSANNLLQYVGEELANRKGRISSRDKLVMHVTGKRSNTGAIRGNDVTLKAPALHDLYGAATPTGAATVKSQDSLAGYFDAEGSGSIPLSDKKDKGFVLIPSFESSIPDQDEIDYQINLRYIDDAEKGKLTIQDFVEWTQFLNGGKPIETMPDFWEPAPEHLANYKHALVPANLTVLPPQIAAFDHPKLRQGAKPRLQFHPHLASDLLRKSLMNSIGFTTISSHIQSPELLLRVLETEGYIEARQAHGLPALPAPHGWDQLTTQQQLARQLKELVSVSDVERFNNPAIVYRLLQDHGELVLSAVMTYPPHIREAFQAVFGKVTANYIHLASTHGSITTVEPVMARKGVSLTSARNLKTHDVYSGGDITPKAEEDYRNVGDVVSQGGYVRPEAGETLINHKTFKGKGVKAKGKRVQSESLVESHGIKDGYKEVAVSRALWEATGEDDIEKDTVDIEADESIDHSNTHLKAKLHIIQLAPNIRVGSQPMVTHAEKGSKYCSHEVKNLKSLIETEKGDYTADGDSLTEEGVDSFIGNRKTLQGAEIECKNVVDTSEKRESKTKCKGFSKTKSKKRESSRKVIQNIERIKGESSKIATVKLRLRSPNEKSDRFIRLRLLDGVIEIESDVSSHTDSKSKKGDSGLWYSQKTKDSNNITPVAPYLDAPQYIFETNQGVAAQVPGPKTHSRNGKVKSTDSRPLNEILDEEQEKPGMAWIKPLRSRNDVLWEPINEIHHISKSNHKGLTTGGAVVIGVVMGVVTGGLGAATILGSTTLAAMASAGAGSLLTQTAVSLINNQGDVRKSMKDLASTDTVVSMATAMAIAGVMDGVFGGGEEATTAGEEATTAGEGASSSAATPSPTTASPAGGASQAASGGTRSILDMSTLEKFQHHLPRTALNMGTATSCHMAVEGKVPSAKGLVQNAVQVLAQSVAHTCANEIGGFYVDNDVDIVSHKLLHAALGAGLGAAVSKNRTEGAIVGAGSAMAAELIAEMMGPSVDDLQSKAHAGTLTQDDIESYWEQVNDTANAARLLTAGAVALTGKDTEAAVAASSNALDNNYLEAAYAATQAHDKPLTEEQRQAGEEFFFDDVALLQSLKELAEGPARDRMEYALARLQQDSLNLLEVPGLIVLLKSSAEVFIAAQFIPTSRFDVALEGASIVTLGMGKIFHMSAKLLRTLQSEKSVVRALSSFTSRTSARVGLRAAEHAGGKMAHLASPSEFGAKFKKSVGFADDFGAPLEFRATYDPHKPGFTVVGEGSRIISTSSVVEKIGRPILFDGKHYMADGFKFSKRYYDRLWMTGGRPAPFIQARSILSSKHKISPDPEGLANYFKYEGAGLEMIYNPKTGHIVHINKI